MSEEKGRDAGAGRQVFTLLSGTTVAQALGLLLSPVVARIYGPEALGLVGAAAVFAALVATIAPLALDTAIVLVERDEEASELAGLVVALALGVGTLASLIVGFGGRLLGGIDSLKFVQSSAVFWSLFVGGTTFLTCYLQSVTSLAVRHQKFGIVSSGRIGQTMVTQVLTLGLGLAGFGAPGAAAGLLIGQFAGALLTGIQLSTLSQPFARPVLPSFKRGLALVALHRRYPIYTYPHALLDSVRENALIGAMLAAGGETGLGYWALVSRTVRGPLGMLGGAFSQVFSARASAAARARQPLRPIMRWILIRLGLASVSGALLVLFLGPVLFRVVFGVQWETAGVLARCLIPWLAINFVTAIFSYLAYILRVNREFFLLAAGNNLLLVAICVFAPGHFDLITFSILLSIAGSTATGLILVWLLRKGIQDDVRLASGRHEQPQPQ